MAQLHPPSTRWEPCTFCGHIGEPLTMVHVSTVIPNRKRGWVCPRCAEKRGNK